MALTVADPTIALAGFLGAAVGGMLDLKPDGNPAVYRPDLPQSADKNMPQKCLVLRVAGGNKLYGNSQLPVSDPIIDITCYGATRMEADNLARAVSVSLKRLVMTPWENVMIYWAHPVGAPIPLLDAYVLWPASVVSVHMMHADHAQA